MDADINCSFFFKFRAIRICFAAVESASRKYVSWRTGEGGNLPGCKNPIKVKFELTFDHNFNKIKKQTNDAIG